MLIVLGAIAITAAQDNPVKKKKGYEYKSNAQDNQDLYVLMRYKWKKSKEGKAYAQIKFINKTKSAVEVDAQLFFYNEGILEERAEVNTCLKKGFWNNWFRPIHIIENDKFNLNSDGESNYSIEEPELTLKLVDKCDKLHD
tara:strand:+ start:630 stop:1052 length:423 start_codon:yes stop_codon:yes gene_type:complete